VRAVRAVCRFADRRLGLLTTADLVRAGVSHREIEGLVLSGLLVRMHHGVYRLAGSTTSIEQSALAACLACGKGAVASDITAGVIWGIVEQSTLTVIEVTVPYPRRSGRPGILVRRSRALGRDSTTTFGYVPVTRVHRTLQDISRRVSREVAEQALDGALRRRIVPSRRLLVQLSEGSGLMKTLATDRLRYGIHDGTLERLAIAALRRFALPEPVRQHEVRINGRRYRIDLAYPNARIGIELKGRAPHWGRDRWQADHHRDNALELAGFRMLGFTWWDVTERPGDFARQVAEALALTVGEPKST
jgi:very-short-patch-repair endonuclease